MLLVLKSLTLALGNSIYSLGKASQQLGLPSCVPAGSWQKVKGEETLKI
nr:hypothetical protein Q903MT_gene334 [Picea sitchensis]